MKQDLRLEKQILRLDSSIRTASLLTANGVFTFSIKKGVKLLSTAEARKNIFRTLVSIDKTLSEFGNDFGEFLNVSVVFGKVTFVGFGFFGNVIVVTLEPLTNYGSIIPKIRSFVERKKQEIEKNISQSQQVKPQK